MGCCKGGYYDQSELEVVDYDDLRYLYGTDNCGNRKLGEKPVIPTKVSELENDNGYITSADIPEIPTKTSDLENDSGFITASDIPDIPLTEEELNSINTLPDTIQQQVLGDGSVEITATDVQVNQKYSQKQSDGTYTDIETSIVIPSATPDKAGAYPADHYAKVQNIITNGDGQKFFSDDGQYKGVVDFPIAEEVDNAEALITQDGETKRMPLSLVAGAMVGAISSAGSGTIIKLKVNTTNENIFYFVEVKGHVRQLDVPPVGIYLTGLWYYNDGISNLFTETGAVNYCAPADSDKTLTITTYIRNDDETAIYIYIPAPASDIAWRLAASGHILKSGVLENVIQSVVAGALPDESEIKASATNTIYF